MGLRGLRPRWRERVRLRADFLAAGGVAGLGERVREHVEDPPVARGEYGAFLREPQRVLLEAGRRDEPVDAIQAATINAADLIGWADKVGALEKGHFADVIAVDGDPLADVKVLESVKFVMKGGKVVRQ